MAESKPVLPDADVQEMKQLLDEYKIRATKFAEKASFMESKVAELRIEHEVALKRAMIAEKELIHLSWLKRAVWRWCRGLTGRSIHGTAF